MTVRQTPRGLEPITGLTIEGTLRREVQKQYNPISIGQEYPPLNVVLNQATKVTHLLSRPAPGLVPHRYPFSHIRDASTSPSPSPNARQVPSGSTRMQDLISS